MTPRAKPKPTAVSEAIRIMRIYDILVDEIRARGQSLPDDLLAIAEHLAARTEG